MGDFIVVLNGVIGWLRIGFSVVLIIAAGLATLAWAERTRRINAFGAPARFARKLDPMIAPVERRAVRFGVTHANAPWWALLALLLVGAAFLGLLGYLRDTLVGIYSAATEGPRGILRLVVASVFMVLQLALIVRVVLSWIGGTYSRIGQLTVTLTEWFLAPLRRVLPTIGMIDLAPLVAYFALSLLRGVALSLI